MSKGKQLIKLLILLILCGTTNISKAQDTTNISKPQDLEKNYNKTTETNKDAYVSINNQSNNAPPTSSFSPIRSKSKKENIKTKKNQDLKETKAPQSTKQNQKSSNDKKNEQNQSLQKVIPENKIEDQDNHKNNITNNSEKHNEQTSDIKDQKTKNDLKYITHWGKKPIKNKSNKQPEDKSKDLKKTQEINSNYLEALKATTSNLNSNAPKILFISDYEELVFKTASEGNIAALASLLDIVEEVDIRNSDGATPLLIAVRSNKLESVKFLIARGADPNAKDHKGLTPLKIATQMRSTNIINAINSRSKN